ncbi:hypothetical protein WR25_21892 [Diploscapter pachys]|uniref:NADAR domain-containing protein n=1 Tax=Diploscapter pachys TaxID=2018661 RepID=A0A2A2LBR7_9BILA|nr:hypothetical protein WR25_21892 [Diploscapter pachys]
MSSHKRVSSSIGDLTLFYSGASSLSNFHLSQFESVSIDGSKKHFTCVEQYFKYNKALYFNDQKTAEEILAEENPMKMRAVGRTVKGFDEKKWDEIKEDVMKRGLLAKFKQNNEARKELFESVNSRCVFCAPSDPIWGIGLDITDDELIDDKKWKGQNKLGRILDEVREELWMKPEYAANKAILFKDDKMRDEIMNNAEDPWHVKACGRKVKNFDNDLWEEKSYEIMKTGVREKFQQNPEFLRELLKIGKTHRDRYDEPRQQGPFKMAW